MPDSKSTDLLQSETGNWGDSKAAIVISIWIVYILTCNRFVHTSRFSYDGGKNKMKIALLHKSNAVRDIECNRSDSAPSTTAQEYKDMLASTKMIAASREHTTQA